VVEVLVYPSHLYKLGCLDLGYTSFSAEHLALPYAGEVQVVGNVVVVVAVVSWFVVVYGVMGLELVVTAVVVVVVVCYNNVLFVVDLTGCVGCPRSLALMYISSFH
jgi:hypothetical protein